MDDMCVYIHKYIEVKILNMKLSKLYAKIILNFPTGNIRALQGTKENDEAIVRPINKGITS